MSAQLATYVTFDGFTADAMTHWHEVFGGDLTIMRYGDMTMGDLPFEPDPNAVAHATLDFPGGHIAGGDSVDGKDYPVRDTAYSFLYTSANAAEAEELFTRLLDGGGSVAMPLEEAPWGGLYGQVFDRFGVMWAFSCEDTDR